MEGNIAFNCIRVTTAPVGVGFPGDAYDHAMTRCLWRRSQVGLGGLVWGVHVLRCLFGGSTVTYL